MNTQTKTKITELIRLYEITDPCDEKIEHIADQFPSEYNDENEYVDFQQDIGNLVKNNQNKGSYKMILTEQEKQIIKDTKKIMKSFEKGSAYYNLYEETIIRIKYIAKKRKIVNN